MRDTFLDDVLMQVALHAYRAAGEHQRKTLEERTGPGSWSIGCCGPHGHTPRPDAPPSTSSML